MRQRVVIALALAAEPKLVIADEPTTALDVSIQAQIITLLKRLCRDKRTAVMLITHDMGVIAETADRVAVMYAGRIAEIGPVAEVIHRPQHPYTVGLMGSIPSFGQDKERLAQIEGSMPRLTAIPSGCAFHPRCPKAFDRCLRRRPDLLAAGTSLAACWLHDSGAARTQDDGTYFDGDASQINQYNTVLPVDKVAADKGKPVKYFDGDASQIDHYRTVIRPDDE